MSNNDDSKRLKVYLKKDSNTYIKVIAESKIVYDKIYDYFSFKTDAGFLKSNKYAPSSFFNTYTRLFNKRTNKIYIGLLNQIVLFCQKNDFDTHIDPALIESFHDDTFDEKYVENWISTLNLSSNGEKIFTRDFQTTLIKKVIENKRLVGLSATSSGKSLVIYVLLRWFIEQSRILNDDENKKILIIVPSVVLVNQLYNDFLDYSKLNKFDVAKYVAKIYAGKDRNTDHRIKISTWQSLQELPDEYFEDFSVVICDEVHKAKAKVLTDIIRKCYNTEYRVGLTGSLDNNPINKIIITGLFGQVHKIINAKDLIDMGAAAKPVITINILEHTEKMPSNDLAYNDEVAYFRNSESRSDYIIDLLKTMQGNTMILAVNVGEMILPLSEKISEMLPDKNVMTIYGGTDVESRIDIRDRLESTDNNVLVCSYETVGTGFSVKNIQNMIFAQSYKSIIKIVQAIGRGIRIKSGKTKVFIHDIIDVFSEKMNTYSYAHGVERMRIYRSEGHDFKINKVKI